MVVFLRRCALLLCGVLALTACSPAPTAPVGHAVLPDLPAGAATWSPWPSALHDARHSGASPAAGPTSGRIRWQRNLGDAVAPGPVIGKDGTIYVATNAGILHAIDPATGTDRWTYDSHTSQPGADLSVSPLVLPNGNILFPTPGTSLVALSPAGHELWQQNLPGRPTSPVTTNGTRVYVGDQSGSVTAIDLTGAPTVAWTIDTGAASYASVVTNGTGAVYTTSGTSLVAITDHGTSASIAWRADPHDGDTEVSPGLAPDGTILLGTNGSQEWAYRPDGSAAWHSPRVITYSSPSVTATDLAYVGDHTGTVHVLDTATGTESGSYRVTKTQIWSSTVVDRDYRVYFGGQNGHVYGVSPGGAVLFDVDLGAPIDSYPALTGTGMLVVGATNGTFAAIS
ncbi:MAG TPA: PQQ-binding-like beta-propeller repeat protein [Pseudonocardiaceae bacterium]